METRRDRLKREIGDRILLLRTQNHLTKEELTKRISDRLGAPVSPGQIRRWEKAANLPEVDHLMALAQEFNLSLEELVVGEKGLREQLLDVDRRLREVERRDGKQ